MSVTRRFPREIVSAIQKSKILGIRAGTEPHRFIGVWVVVVSGRVFVRSWSLQPRSWYRTFRTEPRGAIQIADQEIPVRAVRTRSEQLKEAVDQAYREKYNTPGSLKYVADMTQGASRDSTTEIVPL